MPDSPDVIAAANQLTAQRQIARQSGLIDNLFGSAAPDITGYQTQRAAQGYAPYSSSELSAAAPAVNDPSQATAPPQGSWWDNFTSDVGSIAGSITKLPYTLATEIPRTIENFPHLGEELSKATNSLETIGALAQTPGLRLIPGSYLASTLAPGGPGLLEGVHQHPLFSALDVLPYASKAASLSHTVGAVDAAASEAANTVAEAGLAQPYGGFTSGPVSSFITHYHPSGVPEPVSVPFEGGNLNDVQIPTIPKNPIGNALDAAGAYIKSTPPGKAFDKAIGSNVRTTVQMANRALADLFQDRAGLDRTAMEQAGRVTFTAALNILDDHPELSTEDRGAIFTALTHNDVNNTAIFQLAPNLQDAATRFDTATDAFTKSQFETGNLGGVQYPHGMEYYDVPTAEKIQMQRAVSTQRAQDIANTYQAMPGVATDPVTGPLVTQLQGAIDNHDWAQVIEHMSSLQDIDQLETGRDFAAARSSLQATLNLEDKYRPARLDTLLRERIVDRLMPYAKNAADPELAAKLIAGHVYSAAGLSPEETQAIIDEVESTWKTLPQDGADPTYVHQVTPDTATQAIVSPRIADYAPTPSSTRDRLLNPTASTTDPFIALSHQALEFVNRDVMGRFAQQVANQGGQTARQLMDRFTGAYRDQLKDLPPDEILPTLDRLVKNDFVRYDPETFFNPNAAKSSLNVTDPESQIYIRREVANALNDIKANQPNRLAALTDPLMKIYRTSIMPFSPKFYAHGPVTGALLSLLNLDNPISLPRYAKTAWDLVRDPDGTVQASLRSGAQDLRRVDFDNLPPYMRAAKDAIQNAVEYEGMNPRQAALDTLAKLETGKALNKFWRNSAIGAAQDGIGKLRAFSQNWNAFAKDFYSVVNYLEGYDKSLLKGLTEEEAKRAGVAAGRRLFETWDVLTPAERTVIRSIYPFYGMTRNLLHFVAQYPATHPWRLSILSNFAKAEEKDFGTGLPQQLQDLLFFGSTSTPGRVNTFSPGGLNPFRDFANYPALLGFLGGKGTDFSAITSNLNPVLSYGMNQMGIDTRRGQSDMFPDYYWDAASNSLAVKPSTTGGLMGLAQSVIPQTQVISDLTGQNDQFKAAMASGDHEAAARQIMGAMGIPAYTRTVDLPAQRLHQELTITKQQSTDFTDALKTGDWSAASAWPGLQPALDKLRNTPPEVLQSYLATNKPGSITPKRVMKSSVLG